MPSLIRRKSLGGQAYLGGHTEFEFVVSNFEEGQEFADEHADVLLVDQRVGELEGPSSDGDVAIAKTVEDDVPMSLDGVCVHGDDFVERVQRDVSSAYGQQVLFCMWRKEHT